VTLLVAAALLIAGALLLFGLCFGVGMLLGKRIDRAMVARFDADEMPDNGDATVTAPEAAAEAAGQAATGSPKENDGRE